MQTVNALWFSGDLGPVYAACLRSFVRHGHDVVLHTYECPSDLPDGIKVFDASKLMKKDEFNKHKSSGPLALAADIYRYRLLKAGFGLYVDCDIFCVKPIPEKEYIFGWESDELINGAILSMPANSDLLNSLTVAAENPYFVPEWLSKKKQRILRLRKLVHMGKHVGKMQWGTIGPILLTHSVKKLNMSHLAEPIDVFYPLHFRHLPLFERVGLKIENLITPNTVALHLTNTVMKLKVTPNTPLHELINS